MPCPRGTSRLYFRWCDAGICSSYCPLHIPLTSHNGTLSAAVTGTVVVVVVIVVVVVAVVAVVVLGFGRLRGVIEGSDFSCKM